MTFQGTHDPALAAAAGHCFRLILKDGAVIEMMSPPIITCRGRDAVIASAEARKLVVLRCREALAEASRKDEALSAEGTTTSVFSNAEVPDKLGGTPGQMHRLWKYIGREFSKLLLPELHSALIALAAHDLHYSMFSNMCCGPMRLLMLLLQRQLRFIAQAIDSPTSPQRTVAHQSRTGRFVGG